MKVSSFATFKDLFRRLGEAEDAGRTLAAGGPHYDPRLLPWLRARLGAIQALRGEALGLRRKAEEEDPGAVRIGEGADAIVSRIPPLEPPDDFDPHLQARRIAVDRGARPEEMAQLRAWCVACLGDDLAEEERETAALVRGERDPGALRWLRGRAEELEAAGGALNQIDPRLPYGPALEACGAIRATVRSRVENRRGGAEFFRIDALLRGAGVEARKDAPARPVGLRATVRP